MRFMQRAPDGGKKSGVSGFFFIEIKSLFSIVLLRFNPGSREGYHSHAFNAITFWLKGRVVEDRLDTREIKVYHASFRPKFTPRRNIHRIIAAVTTYALCIRGPWHKTWCEYDPKARRVIEYTHGRVEVGRRQI